MMCVLDDSPPTLASLGQRHKERDGEDAGYMSPFILHSLLDLYSIHLMPTCQQFELDGAFLSLEESNDYPYSFAEKHDYW